MFKIYWKGLKFKSKLLGIQQMTSDFLLWFMKIVKLCITYDTCKNQRVKNWPNFLCKTWTFQEDNSYSFHSPELDSVKNYHLLSLEFVNLFYSI